MSVPKLRFKDENGQILSDWREETLLNLSISGFSNGVFNDPTKVGRGYKLINVLDMYIESTINENKLTLVELSEDELNRNKVEYGDVFFTRSSLVKEGIAHSNIYLSNSKDVTFDGHLIKMSPKKDLLNPIFFYYLLKTSQVRKQLVKRGKTTTMTTIGQADIATVKVAFPEVNEQTKIADFLMAVDEKIAQLTQKCKLLARYKKGVMQQIFSQEFRFKDDDGSDFPEWETYKLKDIVNINPKSTKLPDSFIYIDLESVKDGCLLFENRIELETAPSRAQRLLQKNDILYQTVRPYQRNNLLFDKSGNYVASTGYSQIRTDQDTKFIFQLLYSDDFVNDVLARCTGTSYPAIDSTSLSEIQVNIPDIPEQTKIANFLTSLDEKITEAQTYLDTVKQYKQGLLQQMFV